MRLVTSNIMAFMLKRGTQLICFQNEEPYELGRSSFPKPHVTYTSIKSKVPLLTDVHIRKKAFSSLGGFGHPWVLKTWQLGHFCNCIFFTWRPPMWYSCLPHFKILPRTACILLFPPLWFNHTWHFHSSLAPFVFVFLYGRILALVICIAF